MSKKHRGAEHEEEIPESWLLPYSDLMTLLLALFIVLFATNAVDEEKFAAMAESFSEIMGGGVLAIGTPSAIAGPGMTQDEFDELDEQSKLEELQAMLRIYLEENGLTSHVSTSIDERGLVISMNNAVFFDPASAELKPEYQDILARIGQTINRLDNYIRVEGHTDTVPINTEKFPTNWELSLARAARVVRLFQGESGINPSKMMAVGYGEYKPIADNDTEEGKAKNRRVDIILLSSRFNSLEEDRLQ